MRGALRPSTALILASSILTASCGLPRDPEKTSERVASTHELRVGVSDNPPWTITNGAEPTGIEPDLIRRFASSIGAHVLWTRASETQLVQALKEGQLDVVAAGLEKKTQWSTTAGASQPYGEDGQGKKH